MEVAEIEWKGIIWKAAYGDHSVKDLLTILKGFGPMEILAFEKPGHFRGQLSLRLAPDGTKEITVYHLEVLGALRRGEGRKALQCLKRIFRGEVYVEDPGGIIRVTNADSASLPFWIKMYQEGIIDALEGEHCRLRPHMTPEEVEEAARPFLDDRQDADGPSTDPERYEGKRKGQNA